MLFICLHYSQFTCLGGKRRKQSKHDTGFLYFRWLCRTFCRRDSELSHEIAVVSIRSLDRLARAAAAAGMKRLLEIETAGIMLVGTVRLNVYLGTPTTKSLDS